MPFTLTEHSIKVCEDYLDRTGARNTEIETFLVRYLLILACAEYEEVIEGIVARKAETAQDPMLSNYVKSTVGNVFRSLKIGEIRGLLGRFDDSLKDELDNRLRGTSAASSLGSIVTNRDAVAHTRTSVQMGFSDLKTSFEESKKVISAFASCLGVRLT